MTVVSCRLACRLFDVTMSRVLTDSVNLRTLIAGLPALLFGAAGCGGDDVGRPDVLVGESAHFIYYGRASDRHVCPDVLDRLESHLEAVERLLGFSYDLPKIRYFKYESKQD